MSDAGRRDPTPPLQTIDGKRSIETLPGGITGCLPTVKNVFFNSLN